MSKPEWGVKRTCPNCEARFYDLQKEPITCPACGATYDVDPRGQLSPTRESRAAAPAEADEENLVDEGDLGEDGDESTEEDEGLLGEDEEESDARGPALSDEDDSDGEAALKGASLIGGEENSEDEGSGDEDNDDDADRTEK